MMPGPVPHAVLLLELSIFVPPSMAGTARLADYRLRDQAEGPGDEPVRIAAIPVACARYLPLV
jgi:hypothetical protein